MNYEYNYKVLYAKNNVTVDSTGTEYDLGALLAPYTQAKAVSVTNSDGTARVHYGFKKLANLVTDDSATDVTTVRANSTKLRGMHATIFSIKSATSAVCDIEFLG